MTLRASEINQVLRFKQSLGLGPDDGNEGSHGTRWMEHSRVDATMPEVSEQIHDLMAGKSDSPKAGPWIPFKDPTTGETLYRLGAVAEPYEMNVNPDNGFVTFDPPEK